MASLTAGNLSYDPSFPLQGSFQVPKTAEQKALGIVALLCRFYLEDNLDVAWAELGGDGGFDPPFFAGSTFQRVVADADQLLSASFRSVSPGSSSPGNPSLRSSPICD